MALPVTISTSGVGPQNSYHGPFKSSGGNFYTILRGSTGSFDDQLLALKATDPTSSFAEQDSGNRPAGPSGGQGLDSIWVFQDSDDLHCIYQQEASHDVVYARFDMSSDGWIDLGTSDFDIIIENVPSGPTAIAVSVAVRSDGDIVVTYQGDSDMLMGAEWERIDFSVSTDGGVNWAAPTSIDGANEVNWTGCVIVPGKDDRMHVFFKSGANDAYQRRINSDDSLETFPSAFDTSTDTEQYIFGPGVSYDDGGTQRVRCPYLDSSGVGSVAKLDSGDTPSVSFDASVADEDVVTATGNPPVLALAVDNKNLQFLYSQTNIGTNPKDLMRDQNDDDAGWGTDSLEVTGTFNHISPNVYDRSGTKLAFIYDDGGTVKYNEIDIDVAAFAPDVKAFRFYEDGTESGSSPIDSQDTDINRLTTSNSTLHLRYRVDETGGIDGATTDDYALQYSKNSGGYTAVTAASSNVKVHTASSLTADGATTDRATNGISNPGSGSFVAGEQEETNGTIEDRQLTADNFTEHVWALELVAADVANGDTLDFRVTLNGGTPGMTQSVTPTITIESHQSISATSETLPIVFGTATVAPGALSLSATSDTLPIVFGSPTISNFISIAATAIPLPVVMGSAGITVSGVVALSATGDTLPVVVGDATVTIGAVSLSATSDTLPIVFGSPGITNVNNISATAIAITIAVGDATVDTGGENLAATAVPLPVVVGDATVTKGAVSLSATSDTLPIVFGTPSITIGAVSISATSDTLPIVFGTPSISAIENIAASAIAITIAVGDATIDAGLQIAATGVPLPVAVGDATVTKGAVSLSATGDTLPVVVGDATVTIGAVSLSATGDTLPIVFGTPSLTVNTNISATGITMPIVVGDATLTIGVTTIAATSETLPIVVGDATVIITGNLPATGVTLPIVIGDATLTIGNTNISATAVPIPVAMGSAGITADAPVGDSFDLRGTGTTDYSGSQVQYVKLLKSKGSIPVSGDVLQVWDIEPYTRIFNVKVQAPDLSDGDWMIGDSVDPNRFVDVPDASTIINTGTSLTSMGFHYTEADTLNLTMGNLTTALDVVFTIEIMYVRDFSDAIN